MAGEYFSIKTTIDGDGKVIRRWTSLRAKVPEIVRVEMDAIGTSVAAQVQNAVYSAVQKRHGRLGRSINHRIKATAAEIKMWIGPRRFGYYGKFLEKGVDRSGPVKGYTRRVKSGDVKGAAVDKQGNAKVTSTGKARKGTVAQGIAFVRAHNRHMIIRARPFAQPIYRREQPRFADRIMNAVHRGERSTT